MLRTLTTILSGLILFIAAVFWPAGTIDWLAGWVYVGFVAASMIATVVLVRHINPELIERRLQVGEGTKRWDRIWSAIFRPLFVFIHIVAGLDAMRFAWSTMSQWLWPVGFALFASGMALVAWAMAVNRFFETNVRIQTDRGHRVIDAGPYAVVRHPGYVGFAGWCLAVPMMLGSWWAFVPAVLAVVSLAVRTVMEDRTLREELPGYADYTRRVGYRLIPGIW